MLDAAVTALIAMHDLKGGHELRNSRAGSVYIVKPKMHGPDEVALRQRDLFGARRGHARAAAPHAQDGHHGRGAAHHRQPQGRHPRRRRPRLVHQHRLPRPHRRRDPHLDRSRPHGAQERHEGHALDQGLRGQQRRCRASPAACPARRRSARACGPRPDAMADMLAQKIAHPKAGANTAWVPSPTAATLHALHYHQVDVFARQEELTRAPEGQALGHPHHPGVAVELGAGRRAAGARQQLPGHPRLRGALDRPGRRLLEGAGHPRCRPDGRSRDVAHLQPAHRQLAAPRRRHRGAGDGDPEAHGEGRGPAERGRSALHADGGQLRRARRSRPPAT